MKKAVLAMALSAIFLTGCMTVDVEKNRINSFDQVKDDELIENGDLSDDEYIIHEKMKENDVQSAVVFLEAPETIYGNPPEEEKILEGGEALKQHLKDITELPKYSSDQNRLKAWYYRKGHVYQLHCQTFHTTVIQLEPGEILKENPYLSETDVWRLSFGQGIADGLETTFLMLKPDYAGLTSTLTLVTDRRLYMIELKSYKDHYMPFVSWVYPNYEDTRTAFTKWENDKKLVEEFSGMNAENLSFDYKIRHSINNKPAWLPVLVYDDGQKTYIVLDKKSLNMTVPTVFKKNREIVNKEFRKNIIVINELIEKVTLRSGKQKVTIIKKKSKK
ncbi:MAG: TrbG/VirB9 family P-type conjugative transfer protein [Treponema sp.]|nr:TrbG/VirB9 family P-type conjugative transfer protein [Treponema sp.]